jgi:XTP/dITP diphosphohydrolase
MRLIAATRNQAKVHELERLVGGLAEVLPLPFAGGGDPEEGASFAENACAKAVFWSRRVDPGEIVVATDGGLLIPALGDRWNPPRTRRFAGEARTDVERAEALLALATHLTGDERQILWEEALAVARDGVVVACWTAGSDPGLLARDVDPAVVAAGNGFWIPAVWICPEFSGRRLAELSASERAMRMDHWNRLGSELRSFLRSETADSPGAL